MASSVKDLKDFFSTPERPVSAGEMMEFWKSCDEKSRAEFQNAPLS